MYVLLSDLFVLATYALCLTFSFRIIQPWPYSIFCSFYVAPFSTARVKHLACVFAIYVSTLVRAPISLRLTLPLLAMLSYIAIFQILPLPVASIDLFHLLVLYYAEKGSPIPEKVVSFGAWSLLFGANLGLVAPALTWATAAMMLHTIVSYVSTATTPREVIAPEDGPLHASWKNPMVFESLANHNIFHTPLTFYHLLCGIHSSVDATARLKQPLTDFAGAITLDEKRKALDDLVRAIARLPDIYLQTLLIRSEDIVDYHLGDDSKALHWALDQLFYTKSILAPEHLETLSRLISVRSAPSREIELFAASLLDRNRESSSRIRYKIISDLQEPLEPSEPHAALVPGMTSALYRFFFAAKQRKQARELADKVTPAILGDINSWVRSNNEIRSLLYKSLTWSDILTCVPLYPYLARLPGMYRSWDLIAPPDQRRLRWIKSESALSMETAILLLFPAKASMIESNPSSEALQRHLVLFLWCALKACGDASRAHALYWHALREEPGLMRTFQMAGEPSLWFLRACIHAGLLDGAREDVITILGRALSTLRSGRYYQVAEVISEALRSAPLIELTGQLATLTKTVMGNYPLHITFYDWPPKILASPLLWKNPFECRPVAAYSLARFCDTALNATQEYPRAWVEATCCYLALSLTAFSASLELGHSIFSVLKSVVPRRLLTHVRGCAETAFFDTVRRIAAQRVDDLVLAREAEAGFEQWLDVSLFEHNYWALYTEKPASRKASAISVIKEEEEQESRRYIIHGDSDSDENLP